MSTIFIDKIQNIIVVIVEYNFLQNRSTNKNGTLL